MAYTTINKPSDYFNTVLYTGDGNASQAITGVGFQPDWLWIKARNAGNAHVLQDVVRGISGSKYRFLQSQDPNAEGTSADNDGVSSLDSDGFTVGYSNSGAWNENAITYASWNWLAANTTASNTDGTITSTVSANTTAGFSIGTYSGNGISDATIGHGLSSAPEMIIVKRRTGSDNWQVYWNAVTERNGFLNLTNAFNTPAATAQWGTNVPTSSVFYVGNDNSNNASSNDYVFYAFHSVKGYSKFGEYTGNGNADGPFVYTGFKPAFIIVDNINQADDWYMFDNKRSSFNQVQANLKPNTTSVEASSASYALDFLSNGFKLRAATGAVNNNNDTLMYMAFAEQPLVTTGKVPATAR